MTPSKASSSTSEFSLAHQWLAASLFWAFIATLLGLQLWSVSQIPGESFPLRRTLIWQSTFNLAWIPFTVAIWRLVARVPVVVRPWWQVVGGHLVIACLVAVLQSALVVFVAGALAPSDTETFWTALPGQVRGRLYQLVVIYAGIAASGHAFVIWARWREQVERASRLEGELAEARLASLRAQLHPHLLFNSLHAVASLVRESRNADAVRLIAGMSDLLRRMLDTNRTWHTVEDELALARTFLEIQQVRFEERLQVEYDVAPDTLTLPVPTLVLQPLVENSLRHGFAEKVGVGHLRIRVSRTTGTLTLEVHDDGEPAAHATNGDGVGLRNLRARLQTLYRGAASLEAGRRSGGGFSVTVRVPIEAPA